MSDSAQPAAIDIEQLRQTITQVCETMRNYAGADPHRELGERLYAALGEIPVEHWPVLFGHGGVKGASYLATAYSRARTA